VSDADGGNVVITVDGREVRASRGQTVAGVLLAEGQPALRETRREGAPRGLFCGMGICYDCLVTVDGQHNVRACVTYERDGLRVTTQRSSFWDGSR
jgi:predicted molibdopterin-dependent oxidoreductase YjgC